MDVDVVVLVIVVWGCLICWVCIWWLVCWMMSCGLVWGCCSWLFCKDCFCVCWIVCCCLWIGIEVCFMYIWVWCCWVLGSGVWMSVDVDVVFLWGLLMIFLCLVGMWNGCVCRCDWWLGVVLLFLLDWLELLFMSVCCWVLWFCWYLLGV